MNEPKGITWLVGDQLYTIGQRPLLMGIVNVTPDSFSDGGHFFSAASAIEHGLNLVAQGADLLDIGGESTRPGANPVAEAEELRRVLPVIEGIRAKTNIPVSIDTSKAKVAQEACAAGAKIINDVTALTGDPEMLNVALWTQASLILMHMQGSPATMQDNPQYGDVVIEVRDYLQERLAILEKVGIARDRMAIDPGIGFGKRHQHNLELLTRLHEWRGLDRPICLGVSRKRLINRLLGLPGKVEQGDHGTVGVLLQAIAHGNVHIARVHQVEPLRAAMQTFLALEARQGEASSAV